MRLRRKPVEPLTIPEIGQSQRRLQLVTAICLAALVAVMVAALIVGASGYLRLQHQSDKIEALQKNKIVRLDKQVEVDATAEHQMVAEIVKLATQVRRLGGNPGTFTIEKPVVRDDGTIALTTTTAQPPTGPAGPTSTQPVVDGTSSTTGTTTDSAPPESTTSTTRRCLEPIPDVRVCVAVSKGS